MITPDITRLSPNHNPYPVGGKVVVIHATRSGHSNNPTEFEGTLNYMMNPAPAGGPVSSHWVISRTGVKARVVNDNIQAWHAQEDNALAWGIELEQGIEADGFTEAQIDALVEVCKGYVSDFGVLPRRVFSSSLSGFVGHQDTVQGVRNGKSDPGHLFPWDDFIRRLQPASATPDGIGVVLDDGTDVGNVYTPPPGRTIAGIGIHLTDGTVQGLYPPPPPAAATRTASFNILSDGSYKVT